jgi:hypothetical protein
MPVLPQDAEAMAKHLGITVEEATRRLGLQGIIGDLNAQLQEREAATFAGLWIQHEPKYRVVVAFTRDGTKTIRPYVKGTPLAGLIDVRSARYTLAELAAIRAETERELGKLDFDVMVSESVHNNRVEVAVSDRAWFEGELKRVGAQLPEGVELVVVEGSSTARDKDLLLTPPVPGIAFPRQKPVEGPVMCMAALAVGTLRLEGACLQVRTPDGGILVPVWPGGLSLRVEGEQTLLTYADGRVAARAGEEVCLSGGHSSVTDEWLLQQIPAACRGDYWIVCNVRPDLRTDSDLFAVDVVSTTQQTALFLRYKPGLSEQISQSGEVAGRLVVDEWQRCVHLYPAPGGTGTLLWPSDWSLRVSDGEAAVVDGTGQAVASLGNQVSLLVRAVPMDSAAYSRLVNELPCECMGSSWLVDGVE